MPKVWLVEGIGQPFVWGLLRGSIYLPADFVKVNSTEQRKGVLGHELSHIVRFDVAVNILQIIAQAVFWFHPFVWWANKKIRAEREKCCDEMAIARLGAKVKDYSSAIVNILISEYESTRPVPSLAVAGPVNSIEERIKTIMKPGKKFFKRPSLVTATVVLLLGLLTVPTALVLTARAEAKTAPEREEGLARDTFVQPTERDVDEAREEGERGRREVEEQERHRPDVWALEISQHRRELQERERRIERELKGLRDDQDEEARELQAELRQIREQLRDIERELRGPERERREAEMPAPELLQRRRELEERAHQIERELEGLRDDQDKEARELKAELREIRMQVADIERELRCPERERRRETEWRGRAIRPWPEGLEKERELPPGCVWRGESDQLQELFGRLLGYMERMEKELMELREENAQLKRQLQERGQFPRERGREIRERREDSERGEPELRRGRRERERAREPEEAREQD